MCSCIVQYHVYVYSRAKRHCNERSNLIDRKPLANGRSFGTMIRLLAQGIWGFMNVSNPNNIQEVHGFAEKATGFAATWSVGH